MTANSDSNERSCSLAWVNFERASAGSCAKAGTVKSERNRNGETVFYAFNPPFRKNTWQ